MTGGFAVGIVGDPNSGKSVLSYILLKRGISRGYDIFRQEADVASPTTPWFLEALSNPEKSKMAEEIRKRSKRQWDVEKAEKVARGLRAVKRMKELVIVDMGGGRPPVERVTPENSVILREVDAVVIVCPRESWSECFDAWERELREKAPHVKILAKCISNPESSVSVFDPESGVCYLGGLDRMHATRPPQSLVVAVDAMLEYIHTATSPSGAGRHHPHHGAHGVGIRVAHGRDKVPESDLSGRSQVGFSSATL